MNVARSISQPLTANHRCSPSIWRSKQQPCKAFGSTIRAHRRSWSSVIALSAADEADVEEYMPQSLTPGLWDREQYMWDNSFAINNKYNQEPDFNDPEWYKHVTDWNDFWNYQKWDLEIEGLDDEHDVGGNPVCSEQRIMRLFAAIKDVRLRGEVMQWMPPMTYREHFTPWEIPPVEPDKQPLNPPSTHNDLRAISEKRRWKDIMDTEWHRKQELVGNLRYPDPYQDVRLDRFGAQVRDIHWSEERIRNLITMDGLGAKPEDHGAFVENPLVPIDYVQTMDVHYIEETEDHLERIGHLATPEEESRFDTEVMIDALDQLGLDETDLFDEIRDMEDEGEEGDSYDDGDDDDDDGDDSYDDDDDEDDIAGMVVDDGDGY